VSRMSIPDIRTGSIGTIDAARDPAAFITPVESSTSPIALLLKRIGADDGAPAVVSDTNAAFVVTGRIGIALQPCCGNQQPTAEHEQKHRAHALGTGAELRHRVTKDRGD